MSLNITELDVELLPARTTMATVFDASGGDGGNSGPLSGNQVLNNVSVLNFGEGNQSAETGAGGNGGANVVGK